MVESHLTAIVQNTHSSDSPLPDKDAIPPNQRTWTETAERMGAKRRQRRPRPMTTSPPEPSATERIADLNRKKARLKITDPYSGGLRSGRDALVDAQTAVLNTEARARAAGLPLSQPTKRGRKHGGIPALSAPLPSVPPPSAASGAWCTVHAFPDTLTQPAVHNAGAPAPSLASSENLPSGTLEQHQVHTGTSYASPHLTPTWYPVPTPGFYAQAPYHSTYPTYWPYGHFPPSLPHFPPH